MSVREILKIKKGSVLSAPLPSGAPDWSAIADMTGEEVDRAAQDDRPGFRTIRKLLSDTRFDR
jgi:hypothetical protein